MLLLSVRRFLGGLLLVKTINVVDLPDCFHGVIQAGGMDGGRCWRVRRIVRLRIPDGIGRISRLLCGAKGNRSIMRAHGMYRMMMAIINNPDD